VRIDEADADLLIVLASQAFVPEILGELADAAWLVLALVGVGSVRLEKWCEK